ncbi:MAG: T9SS type A sorting domain-containing protein [Bacteroidetes bacterium]|nr:T9SS type A sorting domain-containing protein [Bacteroidota bacterium]
MRALKIICLSVCFSLWVNASVQLQAQSLGDYRSVATGDWGTPSTWQYYNGSAWVPSTTYPGQIAAVNNVTLQSPFIVTVDVNPGSFTNQMNSLRVNNGATLKDKVGALYYDISPAGQLVVDGTVNLTNTTDVTARVVAANCIISPTGNLSAHVLWMVTTFNYGIATITHDVVNLVAINPLSNVGVWANQTNSVFNFGGSSMTAGLRAESDGNTVNYYSSSSNQIVRAPVTTYYNLTLSGTGGTTKSLSANTILSGTLSIQGSSSFSLGGFDLSVAGDWNNSSTNTLALANSLGIVTFNGSTNQSIINTGNYSGTSFYYLNIANTSATIPQITISNSSGQPTRVANSLIMTSGVINLNGGGFTFGSNYTNPVVFTHSGTSASGWFYNGVVYRLLITSSAIAAGSNSGLFPIGVSTEFRPFYISTVLPSTTPTLVSITAPGTSTFANVSLIDGASTIRRQNRSGWLASSFGNGIYNIRAGGTGLGVIGNIADLRLTPATLVLGTAGTNTGTTSNPLVERTGITLADLNTTFYVGSVNLISSPLPVELISFSGEAEGSVVNLNWITRSELHCDYFTVYRSLNGIDFVAIGNKKGSGTTKELNKYDLQDTTPLNGNNYYRLEQTDWDGSKTILSIISVEANGSEAIQVYPNPIEDGQSAELKLQGLASNTFQSIYVFDQLGRQVLNSKIPVDETGGFNGKLKLPQLPAGCYFLKINNNTKRLIIR